ncbi:MAG: hypothetical protein BAJATHORv1_10302 [Candidatus Thorarchaeota archaeon]|nr:MAG: hypothetical protein BAJATHORv1_10302 [Candidatus Thorarchaeota archaeon]
MENVEKGWDEFWAELFRVKHRQTIPGIQQYDSLIVDFCIETLKLEKGDEILDIACGAGDHAIEFAQRGFEVSGFDLSQTLISVADEKAIEAGVNVNLFRGDMREINFVKRFTGAVILSHSFGFFDHEENLRVLEGSFNALVDGGRLILDLMNPYNLPRFQKTWSKVDEGYLLSEPHALDAPSGVLKGRPAIYIDSEKSRIILMNQDAMSNNDIRMYTALEIRTMLEAIGFSRIEYYGQNKLPKMPYSSTSERMVVIAEK